MWRCFTLGQTEPLVPDLAHESASLSFLCAADIRSGGDDSGVAQRQLRRPTAFGVLSELEIETTRNGILNVCY